MNRDFIHSEAMDMNWEIKKLLENMPKVEYTTVEMKEFCQRMPKLELNANLFASLTLPTIKKIYNFRKIRYPYMPDFKEYLKDYHFDVPNYLQRCLRGIWFNRMLLDTPESITVAIWDVIKEYRDDHTVYLELVVPILPHIENMTKLKFISIVLFSINLARYKYKQILVKIRFSIIHNNNFEYCKEVCHLVRMFKRDYSQILVGIDIFVDPPESTQFLELLDECRKSGLKIVIHCGKMSSGWKFLKILKFKPDRLGKCRGAHPFFGGNDFLFDRLIDSKIPIELCLTSHLKAPEVCCDSCHYFRYLYDEKHPLAICVGSKGILQTSLSEQYAIAGTTFELSKEKLVDICESSIMHSFATINEKEHMKYFLKVFKEKEGIAIEQSSNKYCNNTSKRKINIDILL